MNNISVILITFHTGEVLFESIKTCLALNGVSEIIIVNNGNPENIVSQLNQMQENPRIKLLNGHGNIGFARACNIGAMSASGEYLLFINPDCYTDDTGFALKLRDAIETNPSYWFATSLILNSDGSIQKTCRRNLMSLSNAFTQSFGLDKLGFAKINRDVVEIEKLTDISEIEAFSGALFFCSKQRYYDVGCMSEDYFLHVEDMDLCMKIHLSGGKICFVKNAKIYHQLSTSDVTSKFLEWHKARGFVHYLNKFFPWTNLPIIKEIVKGMIWVRYYIKILL